jgi:long-subunit fatty acid transport protein
MSRRAAPKRLALALVALAAMGAATSLVAPRAHASSQDLFGLGARGAALGGAVVSNVTGWASVYYNPAALVLLGYREFTVGYQRADFGLELNGVDYEVEENSNLLIGFTVPLPFGGVMADRLTVGVGFVIPFDSILEADVRAPEEPVFVVVENRPRVIGLHAALGIRIIDGWSIGGGVVALAELLGGLDIAPNATGQLGTVVRDELVADYAPIVGTLVEPTDWLAVGVAFHGLSDARFTFPITADLGPSFPIDVPLLNVAGIAQFDPMQLSGDVTVRPVDGLMIAAGVSHKWWSDFENPIENTTEPVPEQDPPRFSDIWVPRLGVEYEHTFDTVGTAFRLGGFYEPSPVPDQTGNQNYLDSDRIGLGFGAGVRWRELTFDLAVQYQGLADREHTKDPAAVRDPENAGLPSIAHGGSVVLSVFELGVRF